MYEECQSFVSLGTGRYVAKVQQGAAIAKQQATGGPTLDAAGRRKKKEAEEKAARDLAALFAPVIKQPKPPPGVALAGSVRSAQGIEASQGTEPRLA